MDIKIYIFIGLITLLNINVNARNIKKINSHFHREYDMHDEYLARNGTLKISNADPKAAEVCKTDHDCKNKAKCAKPKGAEVKDILFCNCKNGTTGDYCETIVDCQEEKKICGEGNDVNCEYNTEKFQAECNCIDYKKAFDEEGKICLKICDTDEDCQADKEQCKDKLCKCKDGLGGEDCSKAIGCTYALTEICEMADAKCVYDEMKPDKATCKCSVDDFQFDENAKECKFDKCKVTCGTKDDVICEGDSFGTEDVKCNCEDSKNSYDPTDKTCKGRCTPNPCENGGTCAVVYGNATCFCKDAFTGDFCEIDRCALNPCENGGNCAILNGNMTCICKEGFTGGYCEKDVRPPTSVTFTTPPSVSDNETSTSEEFQSTLSKIFLTSTAISRRKEISSTDWGFTTTTGSTRTIPDLCYLHHCRNRGVCRIINYRPRCLCLPPFTGDFCEKDPCTRRPCVNGGTCRIRNTSFNCSCNEPFTGDFCEKDPCTDNPCQNGGTCLLSGNIFKCICKEAFSGDRCESSAVTTTFILQLAILSLMAVSFIVLMSCLLLRRCKGRRC